MTTVQETTIAQNAAIISLLKDLLYATDATTPSPVTENLVEVAEKAASGWLEHLQDDG